MRNILIIYPHWPPSNLAGVHRPRLIANYIHLYGWHPIVLAVHPDYYEEPHDWDMCKTVSEKIEIHLTKAMRISRPRLVGDVGLRGFFYLYKEAIKIIRKRRIDFIWIPIPSFYSAILGRLLNRKTKIPYGIDYIDPWVRDISGRRDWRHTISNVLARLLEPFAIKKASLITGVAEDYYMPALKRNFKTERILSLSALPSDLTKDSSRNVFHLAFPYGFDPHDHKVKLEKIELPWRDLPHCKPLVYAGAFLPNSRIFIEGLFKSIRSLRDTNQWDEDVHLFFLGTGNYNGKSLEDYAKEFGIEKVVHEIRTRFPFLQVLNFLSRSFGVMVIGSTERHYTASKVYQGVMSDRPILAILHQESSAFHVLKEVNADRYAVTWTEALGENQFCEKVKKALFQLIKSKETWTPDYKLLEEKYSSRMLAKALAERIDLVLKIESPEKY